MYISTNLFKGLMYDKFCIYIYHSRFLRYKNSEFLMAEPFVLFNFITFDLIFFCHIAMLQRHISYMRSPKSAASEYTYNLNLELGPTKCCLKVCTLQYIFSLTFDTTLLLLHFYKRFSILL